MRADLDCVCDAFGRGLRFDPYALFPLIIPKTLLSLAEDGAGDKTPKEGFPWSQREENP